MIGEYYDYDSYEQASDYCNGGSKSSKNKSSKSLREQAYESMGHSLDGTYHNKLYVNELYTFIKTKKMNVDWKLVSKYLKPQYFEEFKDHLDWDIVSEKNCFLSRDYWMSIMGLDCNAAVEVLLKLKDYINWEYILKRGLRLETLKKLQEGIGEILAVQRIKWDVYMVLKPTFHDKILLIKLFKDSKGYLMLRGTEGWFEVEGIDYRIGKKYNKTEEE
jgi:hypothetical protein